MPLVDGSHCVIIAYNYFLLAQTLPEDIGNLSLIRKLMQQKSEIFSNHNETFNNYTACPSWCNSFKTKKNAKDRFSGF